MSAPAVRLLAFAAGGLLVAATFVPTNGGGRGGYPYAIFDTSVQREFLLFALEPLAVAVIAPLVTLFLLSRLPSLTAGLLGAFGAQSFILFLAHLGVATFGNPQYNSFRAGSLFGIVGALLLMAAAVLVLVTRARDSSQ
jgi:hypothetical protein